VFKQCRGFEIVSSFQDKLINLPKRGTPHSAGYDIEAASTVSIAPHALGIIDTGLKAYMLHKEVLEIYPRSSLAKNKSVVMINSVGIIDSDFYNNLDNEGHIRIMLFNFGEAVVTINKGERIVQGIFLKYLVASKDKSHHKTRNGGIGSTGI